MSDGSIPYEVEEQTELEQGIIAWIDDIHEMFPKAPPKRAFTINFCVLCGAPLSEAFCRCRGLHCCESSFPARAVAEIVFRPGKFAKNPHRWPGDPRTKRWSVHHKNCGCKIHTFLMDVGRWREDRDGGFCSDHRGPVEGTLI